MDITLLSPKVWTHAVDTFGSEERAEQWMHIPLSELNGRTPEDALASDPQAADEIDAILGRIDYGVYS
jgi:putative toxin-antitoxin system antitoxin component (TIGR02293 family)